LKKELQNIREQGFSFSNGEVDNGAAAISVPIFYQNENLIAGLSIVGPKERISIGDRPELLEMLKKTARNITSDIVFEKGR
jgi:DNA-binding IclR family transcriptional regulator